MRTCVRGTFGIALEVMVRKNRKIKDMIFVIRGVQVIIESDVALLYGYDTKRINETVNRNKKRFPIDFCFQLTEEEMSIMRSQLATSYKNGTIIKRGKKYLPYVFTEKVLLCLVVYLKVILL